MKESKWLKLNVVSHVHNLLLSEHGGPSGTRDDSLLSSALDRPKNKFGYEANCTLHDLAAAYTFGTARNHPFVDGNKRTAFVCGALFLELNGFVVTASELDTVVIMEAVAAGTIDELQLAEWYRSNSVDS
ncbi:MAG: type II toxin-antitoxin system death-on-curing family toxin [Gammaproteobacteria bacterium]|nr:type II toxin-antitoxin system death-on-curing family toxin [Gammaproteobacteria bacterium]MBJ54193.1 type II toxin-antitoxin system death-on-curing family toxin [Gammaproteobacteria bacterium]HBN15818.1 type II toxin-antitoxin system death-on-curing family toxin [Pseudohongiella sp.]|tara:strand:+ start:1278 stop:1667 length:390 start_codon:yes stop_codon:yes gene_type:complete